VARKCLNVRHNSLSEEKVSYRATAQDLRGK